VRPSIWALLSAYKAIFSAATLQGIQLESRFLIEDLWQAMEDDNYPRAFVEALLARLAAKEYSIRGECKRFKPFYISSTNIARDVG
jgi:hypothetical protein